MPEFIPIGEQQENEKQPEVKGDKGELSEVQKAKDDAEIKKYQAEAKDHEEHIKSVDDLKEKRKQVDIKLAEINAMLEAFNTEKVAWGKKTKALIDKLASDKAEWERQKSNEIADIESKKMSLDKREGELNAREQRLDVWQGEVNTAWEEVKEIRASLNADKLKELQQEEENKKLINRLKSGGYEKYEILMKSCLDVLWKYGFRGIVKGIDKDLMVMQEWVANELPEHFDELVGYMKEQVNIVNKKAGLMAQNPKEYPESSWNRIVDNIEQIVELIPEVKPPNWVENTEGDLVEA
jgi:DNA repair exonuclease SbcCD ATPase subunit